MQNFLKGFLKHNLLIYLLVPTLLSKNLSQNNMQFFLKGFLKHTLHTSIKAIPNACTYFFVFERSFESQLN